MNKPFDDLSFQDMQEQAAHLTTKNRIVFQGSVIDKNGEEQPITEEMILAACEALEESTPAIHKQARNLMRQGSSE